MQVILSALLFPLCLHSVQATVTGYQFEDNRNQKRFLPENGEMTYKLPSIPTKISACFSLYINFNRYSSLVPIMDFRTEYNNEYLDFLYGMHF